MYTFFAHDGYNNLRRLLLHLNQMWRSIWITKVSLTITSGILIELMILPCFAHTTVDVKIKETDHRHIDISAYEFQYIDTLSSLKNGQWTDPSVWSVGRVPTVGDVVLLLHTITIPVDVLAKSQHLLYNSNGRLLFEDSTSSLQLGFILSANQLRIKILQESPASTTYTYDGQNRLTTITNGNQLSIYSYGDAQNFNRLYQYRDCSLNCVKPEGE